MKRILAIFLIATACMGGDNTWSSSAGGDWRSTLADWITVYTAPSGRTRLWSITILPGYMEYYQIEWIPSE